MNEILKQIKDYPDYAISNLGNVYSYKNGKVVKLSPLITKGGYLFIVLYKNGERKYYLIHRLVAEAFLPNPNNYPQVNHKDENKQNNNVENLEWCTAQYNTEYSKAKQVEQYDLSGNLIKTWKSLMEIQRQLGYLISTISKCCNGIYKQAYGYIWKYK